MAAEIGRLLGTPWIDQHGEENPLTVERFHGRRSLQRPGALLRDRLDRDARTRGVPVGTVDKFQGREAAVVFFTMTTSTRRRHAPGRRVPVLPQPAQRGHQPRTLPGLSGLHRGSAEQPRPHRSTRCD